jgi:hypothetical protein
VSKHLDGKLQSKISVQDVVQNAVMFTRVS